MRLVSRSLWVLALVVFFIGGCNPVTTPPAPLAMTVSEWDADTSAVPLEGVQLCETDTTNCVITDANGDATLLLPVD